MGDAVELRGLRNEHGVVVRVDDDTAERLLSDGWAPVEAEKPKPAAPKRAR